MGAKFGGVHVGCHCWVPLLANTACHCWPILGGIAGPCWGAIAIWVPLLGVIARVPSLGCHCWMLATNL